MAINTHTTNHASAIRRSLPIWSDRLWWKHFFWVCCHFCSILYPGVESGQRPWPTTSKRTKKLRLRLAICLSDVTHLVIHRSWWSVLIEGATSQKVLQWETVEDWLSHQPHTDSMTFPGIHVFPRLIVLGLRRHSRHDTCSHKQASCKVMQELYAGGNVRLWKCVIDFSQAESVNYRTMSKMSGVERPQYLDFPAIIVLVARFSTSCQFKFKQITDMLHT